MWTLAISEKMVKRLKLSQALEKYQKKQKTLKSNKHKHQQSEDAQKQGQGKDLKKPGKVRGSLEKYVPCHIWTDQAHLQVRTRMPFHPNFNSRILLIGEGDFSYCRALVEKFQVGSSESSGSWLIIATTLDSREMVLKKYHKAALNLKFLAEPKANGKVEILFEVDGTKLHEDRDLKRIIQTQSPNQLQNPLTRIIFNFPHTGAGIKDRDHNILGQQKMLLGFFESCARLAEQHGWGESGLSSKKCVYTTTTMKQSYTVTSEIKKSKRKKPQKSSDSSSDDEKCVENDDDDNYFNDIKDQFDSFNNGEAFEIHCTLKTGEPYDAWNVKFLAAKAGVFTCPQSFKFVPELYPGYQHCRTIGEREGKNLEECIQSDGWKEFLGEKEAKTFVFTITKNKKKQ